MDKFYFQRHRLKKHATLFIALLLGINTLLIILTGGIPSAFAHTMYLPILLIALFYGPTHAMVVGFLSGVLVGPVMMIPALDVSTEPLANSAYRMLYFVGLGGLMGVLFQNLLNRVDALHIQTEELSATLMSIGDGVIITDEHANIVSINNIAATLMGVNINESVGKPLNAYFKLINAYSREPVSNPAETVIKQGKRIEIEHNTMLIDAQGIERHIDDSASPIYNKEGRLIGVVIVFRDITKQKKREEEIFHISYHDYLTDIPNRRHYQETLLKYDKTSRYPLGIIIMDMNGLKLLNDAFGHHVGNIALKRIAQALKDHKTEEEFIARIGGDEFAMICPNTSLDALQNRVEAIDAIISDIKVNDIVISLAFGYALKATEEDDLSDVLVEAENNMYKNKVLTGKSEKNDAIQSILATLQAKFNEEKIHSERVSGYCRKIGEALKLRRDEIIELEKAGLYHDIGKISIPDEILKKPGKLTPDEWEIMKQHTVNGYQILRAADRYSNIAEYAMSHHERMDGKGYPNGIAGDDIPLFSRIIAVVDAYEAMTSDRPYRKKLKKQDAIEELKVHKGTQFDPEIVELFITNVLKS